MPADINEAYEASKKAYVEMYEKIKKAAGEGDEEAKKTLRYSIVINGFPILVNSNVRKFIITYSKFYEYMYQDELYLKSAFKDIEFDNLFTYGVEDYFITLNHFFNNVEKIMKYYGYEDFSGEEMFNHLKDSLTGKENWEEYYQVLINAKKKYERMKQIQASRPYSYGGFTGRGFSGVLTAGLLNIAADVIGGAAEQAADNSRMNSIYKDITDVFDHIVTKKNYLKWYITDCETITAVMLDFLIKDNRLPNYYLEDLTDTEEIHEELNSLIQSSKIDTEHYNESLNILIALIAGRPFDYLLYVALCRINSQFKDELNDFLTVNKMIEPFMWAYDPKYVNRAHDPLPLEQIMD